jgi:class 3 adenylate cyclase
VLRRYAGGANKNIGDAFLLVWTINEADVSEHMRHGLAESEAQSEFILETQLTDNALYAFMKIVVDIENSNASGVLSKYAKNRKLLERFPQGFKVRMGFGLHHGWAIEGLSAAPLCPVITCRGKWLISLLSPGAIGSQFKVDASYLSPNVNISARLEAATKQYGVTMLLSGSFVEKLSQDVRLSSLVFGEGLCSYREWFVPGAICLPENRPHHRQRQ